MTAPDALTVLRELLKEADAFVNSATDGFVASGAIAIRMRIRDRIVRLEREQADLVCFKNGRCLLPADHEGPCANER